MEEVHEEIDFNIIENELKKEDVINVFKNDLNIGVGKIISKNTDSVKIVVQSVYDLNLAVVDNEKTLNFEIGSLHGTQWT